VAKKILLVNPWICDLAAYDLWMFPLGLLNIAQHLQYDQRIKLYFLDFLDRSEYASLKIKKDHSQTSSYGTGNFFKQEIPRPASLTKVPRPFFRYGIPKSIIERKLKNIKPDLILLTSGMTYWYLGVLATVELLRKNFKDCPIILGGIYASLAPEHAKENIHTDYVFAGNDIKEVLRCISQYLGFKLEARYDAYHRPAIELLRQKTVLPISGSRGCPFRCVYCASRLLQRRFEQNDPQQILGYIQYCIEKLKTTDLVFYDDALLVNADNFIKPILRSVIGKKWKVRFHTPNGLHAKFIDEELAILMYRSNFKTVRLSLESTLNSIQDKSNKKVTNRQLKDAVKLLGKAGFKKQDVGIYTMLGFPDQTEQDVQRDMEFVYGLGAQIQLASYSLVPGTDQWHEFTKKGILNKNTDLLELSHTAFPLIFSKFNTHTIRRLRQRASELNKLKTPAL